MRMMSQYKPGSLKIGQRVFNRGDQCNPEHFGTITEIIEDPRWGSTEVEITPDPDSYRKKAYQIAAVMVDHVDKGNGSTRIVTIEAYEKRREEDAEERRLRYEQRERQRLEEESRSDADPGL